MEYQSLLLLLMMAATVFSWRPTCPSSEDIYPCKCQISFFTDDMMVTCKGRKTTLSELKSAFSYFSKEEKIGFMELRNLAIGTFPSNLFDGLSVEVLDIYDSEIDFEHGELSFKGLENSLQLLRIQSSLEQKDGPLNLTFGHLEELETLELYNNKITELGDNLFINGSSSLYSLRIRDNRILKIGDKTFEKLQNLRYFELSGNKFGALRRNMIPTSADHLQEIHFDNNGLSDLPEDLFTSLPSLEIIDLQKNKIRTLDRSTWENIVEQLEDVHLGSNPLQCDSDMEWLFGKGVSGIFFGKCAGPAGKKGTSFSRFLREGDQ